jgi:hypothetical protein
MRNSNIEIFQSKDGKTQIEVRFENETVWLNRHQIAFLFDRDIKQLVSTLIMFLKRVN